LKTKVFFMILFLFLCINPKIKAQDVYKLWEGQEIPFYKVNNLTEYEKESWGVMCVHDVTEPTLTIYKANGENSGHSVIVFPGGGYTVEAIYHEGHDIAEILADRGITTAVLKYRLPNPVTSDKPYLVPLTDARRALKLLREKAGQSGITSGKSGVMGFSGGNYLATGASLSKS